MIPHYRPPKSLPDRLDPDAGAAAPGLSIVTACRNRNDNLAQVLPGWLALGPDEVVVVDWSSDEPVADTLAAAGIIDASIRVIRVEGEECWCLSYAFNTGFRTARSRARGRWTLGTPSRCSRCTACCSRPASSSSSP